MPADPRINRDAVIAHYLAQEAGERPSAEAAWAALDPTEFDRARRFECTYLPDDRLPFEHLRFLGCTYYNREFEAPPDLRNWDALRAAFIGRWNEHMAARERKNAMRRADAAIRFRSLCSRADVQPPPIENRFDPRHGHPMAACGRHTSESSMAPLAAVTCPACLNARGVRLEVAGQAAEVVRLRRPPRRPRRDSIIYEAADALPEGVRVARGCAEDWRSRGRRPVEDAPHVGFVRLAGKLVPVFAEGDTEPVPRSGPRAVDAPPMHSETGWRELGRRLKEFAEPHTVLPGRGRRTPPVALYAIEETEPMYAVETADDREKAQIGAAPDLSDFIKTLGTEARP